MIFLSSHHSTSEAYLKFLDAIQTRQRKVTQMSDILKGVAVAFSFFLFFSLMSRIDFLVHGTLYHHGLQFSYDWAIDYWIIYTATFVVFSIIVSLMYWLGSSKTVKDFKFSLALLATVNLLMIGGVQDIMFYVFWSGGLPPNNVIWWWAPWSYLLGTWTSLMQIAFTSLMLCAAISLWIYVILKSNLE